MELRPEYSLYRMYDKQSYDLRLHVQFNINNKSILGIPGQCIRYVCESSYILTRLLSQTRACYRDSENLKNQATTLQSFASLIAA